jgi:hypothetical protein
MKTSLTKFAITCFFLLGIATLLSLCAGCSALRPTYYKAEIEHVSHPFAGWPFGPADEEDALTQANLLTVIERGNLSIEQGLGYKIDSGGLGGGFEGPHLTYIGRISYKFGERKQ